MKTADLCETLLQTPADALPSSAGNVMGLPESQSNSFRAPIEENPARNETGNRIEPIPLSDLGNGPPVKWLWGGYLASQHLTLFTGLWKAGKTTLLANLLREFGAGGELAGSVSKAGVLVVTEESSGLWVRRRDEIGIDDHVHLILRPFLTRPSSDAWVGFIGQLIHLVRKNGYGLIVFDTVTACWPVRDENDAALVQDALMPLHAITESGAAVLLVHHPRKGDAAEGQAARGSGALPGFADIIVELRRFAAQERDDRRRVLTAYSRFDETAPEVVVELTDGGYRTVGTKRDATQVDRISVISELLSSDSPGWTVDKVHEAWPEGRNVRPGMRALQRDLRSGVASGQWAETGTGRRNDPYRYRLAETAGEVGGK